MCSFSLTSSVAEYIWFCYGAPNAKLEALSVKPRALPRQIKPPMRRCSVNTCFESLPIVRDENCFRLPLRTELRYNKQLAGLQSLPTDPFRHGGATKMFLYFLYIGGQYIETNILRSMLLVPPKQGHPNFGKLPCQLTDMLGLLF